MKLCACDRLQGTVVSIAKGEAIPYAAVDLAAQRPVAVRFAQDLLDG